MLTTVLAIGHASDVSWDIFDLFVWAQVELQLGIMCASAPSLRVFIRRYLGSGVASRRSKFTGANIFDTGLSNDKSITVLRSISVTFNERQCSDGKEFEESLESIGESASEKRAWSPALSQDPLTIYSHEDSVPMNEVSWEKRYPRLQWSGNST